MLPKNKTPDKAETKLLFKSKVKQLLEDSNLWKGQVSEDINSDELYTLLSEANELELRNLSYTTSLISARYLRILMYYATLLSNTILLTPMVKNKTKGSDAIKDKYYKALMMLDQINYKYWLPVMNFYALLFGVCYGMFREIDGNTIIQLLPIKYCRSRFLYPNGNPVVEFDMQYFAMSVASGVSQSEVLPKPGVEILLAQFDDGFKKALSAYLKDSNERWYVLPAEQGIAYYPLDSRSPFLINIIPDIILLQEYKEIVKTSDLDEMRQILAHKIPLNKDGDDFLLDVTETRNLHKQLVGMLANNPSIDVVTTFGELQLLNTRGGQDTVAHDKLEKIERNVHASAGAPNEIFNPTGNAGLKYSITYGESQMLMITEKFVNILNNKINSEFGKSGYYFSMNLLPITMYNQSEYAELYLKFSAAGYSKLLPMMALGIGQLETENLLFFEKEVLGLNEIVKTSQEKMQEEATAAAEEAAGRPASADENKSDKTVANEGTPSGNTGVSA